MDDGLLIHNLPAQFGGDGSPLIVRLDFQQQPSIDRHAAAILDQPTVEVQTTGSTVLRPVDADQVFHYP